MKRMTGSQIINFIVPIILTTILFAMTLLLFYPGGMSGDSLGQWRQMLLWNIDSWHPPSMAYMWKFWSYLFYGPFAMLFFHSFIYWIALYLISCVLFKSVWGKCLGIILLGIFPPVWLLVGTVWKDTSLLVSFLIAFSLIIYTDHFEKNKLLLVLAFFFIVYGASVRHNALLASLPIIILLVYVISPYLNKFQIVTISLILFVLVGFGINKFNKHMVHTPGYNISNSIFFWDLWGMSIDQNKVLLPDYLFHRNLKEHRSKHITVEELKEYYSPTCNTVIWPTNTGLRGDRYQESFPEEKFIKDFLCSIIQYPESYIKVRTRAIECLLGITCNNFNSSSYLDIAKYTPDHYLYEYSKNLDMGQRIVYPELYKNFTKNYFFKGWLYLVGCILVFWLSFVLSIIKFNSFYTYSTLISLSGLLYWMPYLLIAPCKDFRYNTWMVMSFLLATLFCIRGILRKS